ncbi:MAG: CAP domain-containing protein [Cypionkella sp.]|uniref:CAP domain-containing protein n=1 Tax=Cypionkella sp. TaxID=2811411 RepID=UPI002AB9A830|nr:CAP domain-containing protein [Cypionkella sp.]MDZ4311336.1 CAP domain-containing protein [Cypionkella sp.]MDZ4393765.1 CAP domain-containing protein [Cypionkella sp.]
MALTAAEQYLLELINRARLDPAGEAARYGTDLNAGLAAGTVSTASKQVLAPNVLLENAAIGHSQWMLAADVFSHTGSGGSSASQRAAAAGYRGSKIGEDLSWRGTSGTMNLDSAINTHHKDLFLSAGHRKVMLDDAYQEIGIAQERGKFNLDGRNYDSSMLTELYGKPVTLTAFLTGVIYNDTDRNGFYSIGEGVAGTTFSAQGKSASSAVAGGYAIGLTAAAEVTVTGKVGGLDFAFAVWMTNGNVKVDIVNHNLLLSSGSIGLNLGINNLTLLGNANLFATGNANANVMTGNDGANRFDGGAGDDVLMGRNGADNLTGGLGSDKIFGGNGADRLAGGGGADRIDGGAGNDVLVGNLGSDSFVFANDFGRDVVVDFSLADKEKLVFDDLIWGGSALSAQQVVSRFAHVVAGNVVFEFSANEVITLAGVTTTVGLADALTIV